MAVFTHISAEELEAHLVRFDIGALVSFTGIAEGIDNTNYKLVTTEGVFVLTLFEKRIRPADLPFYISFMAHLYKQGIPAAEVIPDKQGDAIVSLLDKPSLITRFLDGAWPRVIENAHIEQIGQTLARMHVAGESFNQELDNALSLPRWVFLIGQCSGKCDPSLFAFLQHELEWLQKNMQDDLPRGAIHADLFPDNVFFKDGRLAGVIDFYFSCTDVFVYDLMLTLNAWCFRKGGTLDREKAGLLLSSYRRGRPLSAAEKEALPVFGRAAAIRIIATRLYDDLHPAKGAIITPKDPLEYVHILKFYQAEGFRV